MEIKRPTWLLTYSGFYPLCLEETSKKRTSEHERHKFITGNRMKRSHAAPTAVCCVSEYVSLFMFLLRQSLSD